MCMATGNYKPDVSDPKKHNKLLFEKFIRLLESDDNADFTRAAGKLTKFLQREEAYYLEAHAYIIRSLETARATLTRLSGSSTPFTCNSPCMESLQERRLAYSTLVKTVVGFGALFGPTEDVQNTLKNLANSAQLTNCENMPTWTALPVQDPTQEHQSSVQEQSVGAVQQPHRNDPPPLNSATSPASISQQTDIPQGVSMHTQEVPSSQEAVPSATSLAKRSVTPVSQADNPSSVGPVSAHTSATVRPKKRPKLNANKATLLSAVSQDDIKWYASKRGVAEGNTSASTASPAVATTPTSSGTTPNVEVEQPVPLTTVMSDSERVLAGLSGATSSAQPQLIDDDVIIVGHKPREAEIVDLTAGENQSQFQPGEDIRQEVKDPAPEIHVSDAAAVEGPTTVQAELPVDSMDVEEDRVDRPLMPLEELRSHANPSTEATIPLNTRVLASPAVNDIIPQLMAVPEVRSSREDSSSVLETEDMVISEDSHSRLAEAVPAITVDDKASDPVDLQTREQPSAQTNDQEPAKVAPEKEVGPPHVNGHSTQNGLSTAEQPGKSRTPSPSIDSVFEPQTVVLVSVNVGQTRSNDIIIEFEVPSGMETLFTLWKTRFNHDHCLSLACYSLDDITETGIDFKPTDDNSTICKSLLSLRPSWPNNGTLRARVGQKYIFLSPPTLTTGDNFVDLAPYVEGRNLIINLEHGGDLTNYVFALFAHPPTPAQLRDLHKRRLKDQQWRAILQNLARPFTREEVYGS